MKVEYIETVFNAQYLQRYGELEDVVMMKVIIRHHECSISDMVVPLNCKYLLIYCKYWSEGEKVVPFLTKIKLPFGCKLIAKLGKEVHNFYDNNEINIQKYDKEYINLIDKINVDHEEKYGVYKNIKNQTPTIVADKIIDMLQFYQSIDKINKWKNDGSETLMDLLLLRNKDLIEMNKRLLN